MPWAYLDPSACSRVTYMSYLPSSSLLLSQCLFLWTTVRPCMNNLWLSGFMSCNFSNLYCLKEWNSRVDLHWVHGLHNWLAFESCRDSWAFCSLIGLPRASLHSLSVAILTKQWRLELSWLSWEWPRQLMYIMTRTLHVYMAFSHKSLSAQSDHDKDTTEKGMVQDPGLCSPRHITDLELRQLNTK